MRYEELPVTGGGSHAESLLLYSDTLFGKKEYRPSDHTPRY